jgi:hypothetical protein
VSTRPSDARSSGGRIALRQMARIVSLVASLLFVVPAFLIALLSRLARRPIDIGLGPEPLINNIYHKKALSVFGYVAETFVDQVFYITSDFDYRGDLRLPGILRPYVLFCRALFRYRALYIYFNGGPLLGRPILWRLEPLLYRVAGIRVVVMPYGGDIQEMSRSRNPAYKHALSMDYPMARTRRKRIARQIDLWTKWADHVLSGVEWVDYMYHWDTLMLGHFSIDASQWEAESSERPSSGTLRVFHAPNHRAIKGSEHFERAVSELREEGVDVELVTLQRVSNDEVRRAMAEADVVADQLIVGWYAMFALEAMAMGKPVLCYLRRDLVDLYTGVGLIATGEIPIVNCNPLTVKDAIRRLAEHRDELPAIGLLGQEFVRKHHSVEAVGAVFDRINREIGIKPSVSSERS